jgi:hypothetical protein
MIYPLSSAAAIRYLTEPRRLDGYTATAWEKAIDVQAVILKALSDDIQWFQAADILGMHPCGAGASGTSASGITG